MNSKKTTITVSEIVKQKIMDELVEPCFYKDIKSLMSERTIWRKSGNVFETLSKLFVGAASILSFATGLNFWSGTSSVLSLVCMQFSSFSHSESKERSNKMNKLLDKLKVENVPDISSQTNNLQAYQNNNMQSASYRSSYYNQQQYGDPYYLHNSYPYPYPQEPTRLNPLPLEPTRLDPRYSSSRKNSFDTQEPTRLNPLPLDPRYSSSRKSSFNTPHSRKNSLDKKDKEIEMESSPHTRNEELEREEIMKEIEDLKNKRNEELEREEIMKKMVSSMGSSMGSSPHTRNDDLI